MLISSLFIVFLRTEKEKSQKFLEGDFDFQGEGEDINVPKIKVPEDLQFKPVTKTQKDAEPVGYYFSSI